MKISHKTPAILALPLGAALTLASCGERAEPAYEADVVDESGGELIVSDVDPNAVEVDVPDTPMVVTTDEETEEESGEE